MEYPFKDLLPREEATARQGYYRDWTHIDADTFHQISELATFIREKGHGADTREAIAQSLERVYHDATQSGNANMEVSMARKNFKDLASRLDASDTDMRNINVNWINKNLGKLDQSFMTDEFIAQFVENTQPINAVPANLSLTTSKYADKSVTPSKTNFLKLGDGLNLATDFINSYIGGWETPGFIYYENYSNAKTMIIPIEPNTKYSVIFEGSTSNEPKITTTPQLFTHDQVITSDIFYASDSGSIIESGPNDAFLYFSFIANDTLPFVKVVKSDVIVPIVDDDAMYYASGFRVENITPSETTFARFSENSEEKDYETRNFSDFHNPENDGKMMGDAGQSVTSSFTAPYTYTLPISVVGGAKYKFAYRSYCIFNKDGQPIGFEDDSEYGGNPNLTTVVTMPVDAEYIIVNIYITQVDTAKISRRSAIDSERAIVIDNLEINTEKPLANKNILILGDSLNANYNTNIADIIADETGATVVNGALGGSRMCFRPDNDGLGDGSTGSQLIKNLISGDWTTTIDDINDRRTGSLLTKQLATVADLQSVDLSNIDLVIIAYGTNDRLQSVGIGNVTDDESRFKGALRIAIDTLLSNYNHLKIMFVGQPFSFKHNENVKHYGEYEANYSNHVLGDYVQAMQEVADKYHVGFLDNYTNGGMNEFNKLYYFNSNDGIHGKQETFVPLLASRYIRKIEDILTQAEI